MAVETKQMHERARYSFLNFPPYLAYLIGRTQRTRRKIEIDPILAFATQRDASAKEGVHKSRVNFFKLLQIIITMHKSTNQLKIRHK